MINLQNYITDTKLFKTFSIDDLLVVEYKCLVDDHRSDIWTHSNYFAYVMGGEKKWKTPVNEYKVGPGEILFVRKGANTVYQYFKEPFLVIFIFISDDFIRKILLKHPRLVHRMQNNYHNHSLIPVERNDLLESFFQSMKVYFSQSVTPQNEILKLKTEELILNILTQPGNQLLKQFFAVLLEHHDADIKEIMNNNFSSSLTINEYARLCGRSLASFRRDFNKVFDTTPGKWLLAKRIELSRFLLETTSDRVNEIAGAAGFKNRSHFNKTFHEATGISPNEYRRQLMLVK